MPTTDQSVVPVASLLVTIHRDESGAFSTSVETVPPAPRMGEAAELPAYATEWVTERDTSAKAAHESPRGARRRYLIAAAALAVLVGAAAAMLHSPSRGSTVPAAASNSSPASSRSDATDILPNLGAPCLDLLANVAHAIGDPEQWTQTVLVDTVRSGKPLADEVRQWLTDIRADVLATRYADPRLDTMLQRIDSAIAAVDASTCSRAV